MDASETRSAWDRAREDGYSASGNCPAPALSIVVIAAIVIIVAEVTQLQAVHQAVGDGLQISDIEDKRRH